jgi:hypothetical protein
MTTKATGTSEVARCCHPLLIEGMKSCSQSRRACQAKRPREFSAFAELSSTDDRSPDLTVRQPASGGGRETRDGVERCHLHTRSSCCRVSVR